MRRTGLIAAAALALSAWAAGARAADEAAPLAVYGNRQTIELAPVLLAADEFYIPGSVLRVSIDNTTPLGFGFEREADVFFDASPAFRVDAGASSSVRRVAWFATAAPLRSGWAWGQQYLDRGVIAVDAAIGKGHVVLFAPEILQRGQPHATFKLLFNSIYLK